MSHLLDRLSAVRYLVATLVALVLLFVGLGSCSHLPSMSVLPAPSGVTGKTYPVSVEFADVLNLPIGAKVKLDGATIGRVAEISTRDYVARLDLQIGEDQKLPLGTTAQIRFSTPLGELYVAMTPPAKPSGASLQPGAVVTSADTSTAPSIEDTFAAISALLNGGSLNQINVITREMSKVLAGNSGSLQDLMGTVSKVLGELNQHRGSFDTALVSLRDLSKELQRGDAVIADALETFPDAIRVITQQKDQISALVRALDKLGTVTTRTIERGGRAVVTDIESANTVLASLAAVRSRLNPTLDQLIRIGSIVDGSVRGDYLNADATVILDFLSKPLLPPKKAAAASPGPQTLADLLSGGLR